MEKMDILDSELDLPLEIDGMTLLLFPFIESIIETHERCRVDRKAQDAMDENIANLVGNYRGPRKT